MIAGVADTHSALWYLADDPRLSLGARDFISRAAQAGSYIAVSSISLAEVVYLIEKGRLPVQAYDGLSAAIANPRHIFAEAVFSNEVARTMRQVSRLDVPDMPDRMIAATAIHLGVPVISRDGDIRASSVLTIW